MHATDRRQTRSDLRERGTAWVAWGSCGQKDKGTKLKEEIMDQGLDSSMHGEHAYDEDAVRKFQVRGRLNIYFFLTFAFFVQLALSQIQLNEVVWRWSAECKG
jgi:hypothetical protein